MRKVLVFTASFCQPCAKLKEELLPNLDWFKDKVNLEIKDLEQDFALAITLNIRAAPTVVLFDDNGEVMNVLTGITDFAQMKRVLGYE